MSNASGLPRLFHVSPQKFECIDIDVARSRLLERLDDVAVGKSPNGSIGFWLSPYPSACSGFGPEVAEVELSEDARFIRMSLRQLRHSFWDQVGYLSVHESMLAHAKLGDELSSVGDVLFISDGTDAVGEVVVLNESAIVRLNWNCGVCLSSHEGEHFPLEKLAIDEEASRSISSWHFLADGSLEKSAIKRSPALR